MTRRLGRLFLTIIGIISFSFIQAQTAKLTGKITNSKNETLSSVSVKITGAGGTSSDADGRFVLTLEIGKKYELTFSAVGYETKTITDAEVLSNQVNELNIVLEIKATAGENVVVTGRRNSARLESVASIISFQKNTNTVASVISAESIRRSPDKPDRSGDNERQRHGAGPQWDRHTVLERPGFNKPPNPLPLGTRVGFVCPADVGVVEIMAHDLGACGVRLRDQLPQQLVA